MVTNTADFDVGFLADFPADRILQALAWLYKASDRRVATLRPRRLSAQQALVAIADNDNYGGVDAWKNLDGAISITANPGVASQFCSGRVATVTTELLHLVPYDECASMGNEVGFIGW